MNKMSLGRRTLKFVYFSRKFHGILIPNSYFTGTESRVEKKQPISFRFTYARMAIFSY